MVPIESNSHPRRNAPLCLTGRQTESRLPMSACTPVNRGGLRSFRPQARISQEILDEKRNQIDANWSSDGTRIMFGYLHDAENIDISNLDLKTHATMTVPGSAGLFSPRWSPDGRYIRGALARFHKSNALRLRNPEVVDFVNESAGAVSYPVWSDDSRYLYFDDLVTDQESIRRVRIGEFNRNAFSPSRAFNAIPDPSDFGQVAPQMDRGCLCATVARRKSTN